MKAQCQPFLSLGNSGAGLLINWFQLNLTYHSLKPDSQLSK